MFEFVSNVSDPSCLELREVTGDSSNVSSNTGQAVSDTNNVVRVFELVTDVPGPASLEFGVVTGNSSNVSSDASEAIDNANCVIDVREFDSASLELRVVTSNTEQRKASVS